MEIEKLIDALKKARADGSWNTLSDLSHKAANALEQLQAENDRLRRERDAAVESWRGFCSQCAWKNHQYLADGKMDDRCRTCRDNAKMQLEMARPAQGGMSVSDTKKPVFNADAAEEYFSDLLVFYRNTANDIFRKDNEGRHASNQTYSAEYQKYVGMQMAMREVLEYFSQFEL